MSVLARKKIINACFVVTGYCSVSPASVLPILRFFREFGLDFLWICVFLKTCGLLVFGLVLIKICLFYADFCIADCFFIKLHGHFALSIYCKTKFWRVFVYIYSFGACFFRICLTVSVFNQPAVFLFFSIFLPNARRACFSVDLPILSLLFKFACLFLQNYVASLPSAEVSNGNVINCKKILLSPNSYILTCTSAMCDLQGLCG